MNTIWSDHIQGVQTLYLSRQLRFSQAFEGQYLRFFQLAAQKHLRILELGCGPGALAAALHRWYPQAEITGVDRDSRFVAFAREQVPGVRFVEGDAARLPFADGSFDVTISNTVSEHIAPEHFWGEQRRVLKSGGVCLCLSSRRGLHSEAPCLQETAAEKAFWESLPPEEDAVETYQVARYPQSEAGLPAAMAGYGFRCITTGYALVDLTPDDPRYSPAQAESMLEAQRQCALEAIQSAHQGEKAAAAIAAVNEKFDQRLHLYRTGQRQWDTEVNIIQMVRGVKG